MTNIILHIRLYELIVSKIKIEEPCRKCVIFIWRENEIILHFYRTKRDIFFPELNIRLYDENSESDYLFLLHQNQNIFYSNIGNQNIFLEKNHNWKSTYMCIHLVIAHT